MNKIPKLLIILLIAACTKHKGSIEGKKEETRVLIPVVTEEVRLKNLDKYIELTGVLEGKTDIVMRSETNGKIVEIKKDLGDWVNKGESVGRIDNTSLKIQKLQAEASLLAAEASLEAAELQYESSEKLRRQDSISEAEFKNAMSSYKKALASVKANEANLESIKKAVENSEFVVPVSGFIAEMNLEIGELISQGSPICSVVNSKKLIIQTGLCEQDIKFVKRNLNVEIFYENSNYPINGKITGVGIKPSSKTKTYPVNMELDNPENKLLPGMVVKCRIPAETHKDVIYLSLNSIVQQYDTNAVFIIEDNRAVRKKVILGEKISENVIITSGLKQGDQVVIDGISNLEDGTEIIMKKIK